MDTKHNTRQKVLSFALRIIGSFLRGGIDIFSGIAKVVDFTRGRLDFVVRPDDVFIVTYPRSGTTWMQMILYQLTTDGAMDFPHICQVSPWFDRFVTYNIMSPRDFEKLPSPRIIKSHLSYKWIPKGSPSCKYIYVMRDGSDVAVSYYHFYKSHLGFKKDFAEFYENYFLKGKVQFGSWFTHVAEWQEQKENPDILFLDYEELRQDLESSLKKIIDFCGFEIEPERFPEILERCSFAFMKKHETKFDHIAGMVWEKGFKQKTFIRKGTSGEGKNYLTERQKDLFKSELKKYRLQNKWHNYQKSEEYI